MRTTLKAMLLAFVAASAATTPLSAAPAGAAVAHAPVIERVQYGGPYGGQYPPYRRACQVGYHYTCVYEYGGNRRCGCQPDVMYSPNPFYGFGNGIYAPVPAPVPGFDPY
jgi:hypothetical protein